MLRKRKASSFRKKGRTEIVTYMNKEMSALPYEEEARKWFLNPNSSGFLHPLLVASFIFILLCKCWVSFGTSKNNKKRHHPPSPPQLPVLGNLHQLGSFPHRDLKTLSQKYGPLMLLHLGSKPLLVVSSAEGAEAILKTHEFAFINRPKLSFVARLFDGRMNSTFTPYGECWRQARNICVNQFLSKKRVDSFRSVREEEIASMIDKILRASFESSSVFNLCEMFATLVHDIGFKAATGDRSSKIKELLVAAADLMNAFNVGDFIPWLSWVNHFNGLEAKSKKVFKELNECYDQLIEDEINRHKTGASTIGGDGGQEHPLSFLQLLLDVQRNEGDFLMDRSTIKSLIMEMTAASDDTIPIVLEWAMAELLRNKHVMIKLQDEVREVAGCKSYITEEDLEKLDYLKAVIKETFRLHPPVPILYRESTTDINLMGYYIPAETHVAINVWEIGRDPRLWEEPEEFQPERFLNNSIDFKGQHFELLPFGSGRRSCPSIAFTSAIVVLTLANLMCKFNFSLPGGAKSEEDLDMTETPGLACHKKIPLLVLASVH